MSCKAITPLVSRYSSSFIQPTTTFTDIKNFASYTALERDPLEKYDDAQIIDIMIKAEKFAKAANSNVYPTLVDRVTQSPLNPYEIADFLDQTKYDPNELQSVLQSAFDNTNFPENITSANDYPTFPAEVSDFLEQLDYYYNNNIANTIAGGFCAAFSNPFAKLLGLVSLASSFAKKIEDLANGSFSLILTLDAIKEKIMKMIDKLKDVMKKRIENIANQIKGIAKSAFNSLNNKIQALKDFFSDGGLESLKGKIEEFIAKAAGAFQELTFKNIAFLLFRFCQLTDLIQSFLESPIKAMTEEVAKFTLMEQIINGNSLRATQAAVRAGGRRLLPSERDARRQELIDRINSRDIDRSPNGQTTSATGSAGNIPRVSSFVTPEMSDEERAWLNTITASGASGYFSFAAGVTEMSSRAIARFESSGPNDPLRKYFDRSQHYEGAGWREVVRVNPYAFVALKRIVDMMKERFGSFGPLTVNSAYRSPYYNRMIGGAGESVHMSAGALDISTTFDREKRGLFAKFASQQGIKGIGVYSTFTHIDLGSRRKWIAGWEARGSQWVRVRSDYPVAAGDVQFWVETLNRHESDSYRTSTRPDVTEPAIVQGETAPAGNVTRFASEDYEVVSGYVKSGAYPKGTILKIDWTLRVPNATKDIRDYVVLQNKLVPSLFIFLQEGSSALDTYLRGSWAR